MVCRGIFFGGGEFFNYKLMNFENLKVWAICCRVSTEEQETHWSSLESQEELNIQYAKDNNLFVPQKYIFKEQFTGSSIDRPWLTQILHLATQRKIDFVIFTKRDRVARSQLVYQRVKKILEDNNVKILYSLEILTGDIAMDNFVWATMVQFAEWEREQIKQRTYAGKRQYAKNNKWILSHIPYGYKKNFTTKELEIYEEEKRIIEKIVKYLLVDWLTLWVIAKKLTNEKILCPLASSNIKKWLDIDYNLSSIRKNGIYFWSVSNLHRILKRAEMYAWTYQAFKKIYKLEWKQSLFIWERPKEEWISIQIPAIISEKQAKDIIEKMQNNRRFSKKKTQRTYLLQWKLFCDCEAKHHNFVGYFNPKKNLRNYRCGLYNSSKVEKERRCSNHISGLKIEPIVINTVRELLTDTEYLFELSLNKYLWWNARDNEEWKIYLQIYGDYLMIDEKKWRLEELFLDGLIDKESFIKRKNVLDIEKETLAKELSEKQEYLVNSCHRETAKKSILEITKEKRKAIEKFFDEASYEEMKELINIVVDRVIIPKDKRKEIQIIMKIDGSIPSFQEKYSEEVFATYTDENGNMHNICPLGIQEPKLLELWPSSNPYLYRSVRFVWDNAIWDWKNPFANDDNFPWNNFSGQNYTWWSGNFPHQEYDTKFLDYISEKFIASGRCDQ